MGRSTFPETAPSKNRHQEFGVSTLGLCCFFTMNKQKHNQENQNRKNSSGIPNSEVASA